VAELVFGLDKEIAEWVALRCDNVRGGGFGPCKAIGVASGNKLLAGIVYHAYDESAENIQLTMAADNPMWARRDIIAGLLHYPFRQLRVWMLYTLTPPENDKALKVNLHIGFERKTIIPHGFGRRRHAVLCQMTEPKYRQLYEMKANGKEGTLRARCA
jgi:hypothetical protein